MQIVWRFSEGMNTASTDAGLETSAGSARRYAPRHARQIDSRLYGQPRTKRRGKIGRGREIEAPLRIERAIDLLSAVRRLAKRLAKGTQFRRRLSKQFDGHKKFY